MSTIEETMKRLTKSGDAVFKEMGWFHATKAEVGEWGCELTIKEGGAKMTMYGVKKP